MLCALSMATAAGVGVAQAQDVTLRMHHFLPAEASVPKQVLSVWADRVEEDSGGRIDVQRFPSMELGGAPPELVDQAIDGTVDIIWTVAGYTPGRFPRASVFELPFMTSNARETSRALWTLAERTMLDTEFEDLHVLGLWVHGPGVIHSKQPIRLISDLREVALRTPSAVTSTLFDVLGATSTSMPVPAIPEALSTGDIDATVIPWEVTSALKVPELVGHHLEFGDTSIYTTVFVFAMNRERYASLDDELKTVIDANSGLEFSAFAGEQMQRADGPARQLAVERGNRVVTLSPQEVSIWRDASPPTIDFWLEEMDGLGLDGQGLLDQARELITNESD